MDLLSYIQQAIAGPPGRPRRICGCPDAAHPLVAAAVVAAAGPPVLLVARDNDRAERLAEELGWWLGRDGRSADDVVLLPAFEADPYRGLSPHPRILAQRSQALWQLLDHPPVAVVTTPECLLDRYPLPETYIARLLELRLHGEIPLPEIRRLLLAAGYTAEDPVTEPGEFAIRGGVLDVFSPQLAHPVRVEFFGDAVESLRAFDPDSQRSVRMLDAVTIIPMTPGPAGPDYLSALAEAVARRFGDAADPGALAEVLEPLSGAAPAPGHEHLAPLLGRAAAGLWDYLGPGRPAVLFVDDIAARLAGFWDTQAERYQETVAAGRPALPPTDHFHPADTVGTLIDQPASVLVESFPADGAAAITLRATPTTSFLGNFTGLAQHIAATREHILLVLSSPGRCERIHDLCEEYGIAHRWQEELRWADLDLSAGRQVVITQGPLERGFRLPDLALAVFASDDIYPRGRRRRAELPARRFASISAFFSDFRDLKPGDYVVHVDHGVGVFRGLERIAVAGAEQEFAHLEYADRAQLYVPAERLDLVQKYAGSESAAPPMDRLGGATWQKTRARVKKSLHDMANELIRLYARRSSAPGFAFPADDHWQREFENMFEYEETPDQWTAIHDIKRDMESPRPMDRLLCGDVGYGKTEVAMRAAFKAVGAGRQVAVLAPTTVLAFQHLNTFRNRFASYPVRIELLSRFRNAREQKTVLADLAEGKVDVIVGTHRLLSQDVACPRLGLLIVDEEQRFGVRHKERIKQLRADVDVLTLTATPIPRTLHMSIVGIRDISVIETPPKDRLSIQTQVVRYAEDVIQEAVRQELARRGQVYFIHNRIETIHEIGARIRELVPEARVVIAHGQMRESELERILLAFIAQEYDVLLSTTIIENGIDIPLVNTIIIDHAHRFGLAQLYQLRGRVGRSSRRAYAWLLVPSFEQLTDPARKRLAAIRDFTELGAGFRLAALDLEIRGAGNLLGAAQHGHIEAVGFEMYCRLLEEAVRELKGERYLPPERLKLNLHVKLRIPSEYIPQEEERLRLYKRIASAADDTALHELRAEVRDRYGAFPEVLDYLFEYMRLKLLATRLAVLSIERRQDEFRIRFSEDSPVDTERLIRRIEAGEPLAFAPGGFLILRQAFSSIPEMFQLLKSTLLDLGACVNIS